MVEKTAIPGPGSVVCTPRTPWPAPSKLGAHHRRTHPLRSRIAHKMTIASVPAKRWFVWLSKDIAQRHSVQKGFENATTVVILGGSTNAVLHLLAIAHEADIDLSSRTYWIGKRVPVLADVKPSGRYLMSELIAIGGIQPVMKTLWMPAYYTATY